MLSRVAQNIYWMSRYIERAEDTARLVNVNTNLLLDLPKNTQFGWRPVVLITGGDRIFSKHFQEPSEANVVRFLLGDPRNPGSILSSLSAARENLRTTRDVVPREAWEQINDMFLYAKDKVDSGTTRRGRYEFLKRIILGAQQITGLLAGTMSRTHAYDFMLLGRYLERADMTTRILDVRSANLLIDQSGDLNPFDNIQWMSVLKSLTAYQMYRQQVRLRVRAPDVVRFLLQDAAFPRSFLTCVLTMEDCLRKLPRNDEAIANLLRLKQTVTSANIPNLVGPGTVFASTQSQSSGGQRQAQAAAVPNAESRDLHTFADELQIGLGQLHEQIATTYFAR